MNYSQEFTEALDMLEILSRYPQAVETITQTAMFKDFKTMLMVHLEDLE